jgi:hypothetical protein
MRASMNAGFDTRTRRSVSHRSRGDAVAELKMMAVEAQVAFDMLRGPRAEPGGDGLEDLVSESGLSG